MLCGGFRDGGRTSASVCVWESGREVKANGIFHATMRRRRVRGGHSAGDLDLEVSASVVRQPFAVWRGSLDCDFALVRASRGSSLSRRVRNPPIWRPAKYGASRQSALWERSSYHSCSLWAWAWQI